MARRNDPRAALGQLERDLDSGKLRSVYLLFGKESYLVSDLRKRIETVVLGGAKGSAFNRDVLVTARTKPDQVTEAVRTMPMLGARRLVVVERIDEGDKRNSAAVQEALADVVKAEIPTTVLLITAVNVDRRRKLFKAIKKHGLAVECKPLWERELRSWVNAEARRLGKRINGDAVHLLCDMVGNDLGKMHNELQKLAHYVGERPDIRLADAEEAVADLKLSTVFDLTEALGAGRLKEALLALAKLDEAGTQPVRTLWFVTRHFRSLLAAREAVDQGTDPESALLAVGVNKAVAWKVKRQLAVRSVKQLRDGLVRIAVVDDDLRRSKTPPQLLLDQLAIDLCGKR